MSADDDLRVVGALCYEAGVIFGMRLSCQRPLGHEGDHGNGPFVSYSTTWPTTPSPKEESE